ncbi:serine hydrolase [Actinoplanes subtropicus]|uniref:serine hydrolase n=1 Tax=Actinoplanes subtropicus TaxID=543632 RepID=UPI000554298F|nr:serine hydrolase [Actinoplanes subtropicus]
MIPALVAAVAALSLIPGPPTVTGDDVRFTPGVRLHYGSAERAGLVPAEIEKIATDIAWYTQPAANPAEYPGAVALAAHDGVIVAHDATGYALRYADDKPTELPPDQWIPMRRDTIFDIASMTKLFTTIAAVQLAQAGTIGLDTPVAAYLPQFAANGKAGITVRELLTHTSGLPADPAPSLCTYATDDARWAAVYAVAPVAPPETAYLYSDLNMMVLGKMIEAVTGSSLDRVIARQITGPLGMTDTMFNPPAALRPRIAAEEYQPWTGRGIVWGSVHDENAYCAGGVSGHAGIFSTAHDLALLAQTLLDGGKLGHTRILSESSTRSFFTNFNRAYAGHDHGLGFELDQRKYMDALSSPVTAGHTGYTGTDLVLDPLSHSFVILLTNRVHPSRGGGSPTAARDAVARDLALALPVRPVSGRTDWFSGVADATTATLTVPLPAVTGARLSFALWYDTEETDVGHLEATADGTTWQPVPFSLRTGRNGWTTDGSFDGFEGRRWLAAAAELPPGTTAVRWRYQTDAVYEGRGVYVDAIRVSGPRGLLFDDRRPGDAARVQLGGWQVSRD